MMCDQIFSMSAHLPRDDSELDRLRAEVASLKKERDELIHMHSNDGHCIVDLTQQLAAANGRVERMREELRWIAAQPASGAIQRRAVAALSDLPEADKEKS